MFGYRGRPDWRDMSEYVVHFTKAAPNPFDVMLKILWERTLRPGARFGAARALDALGDSQASVCFSEIPLDRLSRLVERRSSYGVAFKQDRLVQAGGARVWYLDNAGVAARAARGMVSDRAVPGMNVEDRFWQLTPFIDFASDEYDYRFEWEREWRVPGGVTFTEDEVAFLFLPEALHADAWSFFENARDTNTGPAYLCPYLDPLWPEDRLQTAFGNVAE